MNWNWIRTALLAILALSLASCQETSRASPEKTQGVGQWSEILLAHTPNGCSLYGYTLKGNGWNEGTYTGRYIICGNGAQITETSTCGKNCVAHTSVLGDPMAIKRAHAYSKLTEEERRLLNVVEPRK